MRKLLDGFFLGVGLSVAIVLVFATYSIVGHVKIEQAYKHSMRELVEEEMDTFVDALGLKLIDSKVVENEILLTTQMANFGQTPNAFGLKMRFSLYTENGDFMGHCEAEIPSVSSNEEVVHSLTPCTSILYSADEFYKATVAVSRS